jgi:quercetin dioxygenase-like cupin family protein
MKYVRVFAGPNGETHFEDVVVEFHSRPSAPPVPPSAISDLQSADRLAFVSFPPGWRSEHHHAPRRQFLVFQAGSAKLQTSDGEIRYFQAGDVLLAEDTTGNGHSSWNNGEDTVSAVQIPLRD